jgi:lipopolysaccharide assembly outer membrane protein LptD (OstA)
VRYRLPYMVMSNLSVDSRGDFRLTLNKAYQLTDRMSVFGSTQYDTNTDLEWMAGFEYVVSQSVGLSASYHSDHGYGLGIVLTF